MNLLKFTIFVFTFSLQAQDWPMYLRDLSHSSFNGAESTLTGKNIQLLTPSWTMDTGSTLGSAPTLSRGVLYVGDWDGNLSALDVRNGNMIWRTFLGIAPDPPDPVCQPGIGITSQAAVVGNTVYVGGGDSSVYALNAANGSILWRVPLADPSTGAYIWSSIMPYQNSLFVGVASLGDCPLVRGELARIDIQNPQRPLIQYLVPPDSLGAGSWSSPAVDPSTSTVFINTGNGDAQDPDSGTWTDAMLSLNTNTLAIQSNFFLPPEEALLDLDWGSSPTLFTTPGGESLVAATAKDGFLYAFRRSDLNLAWQTRVAVGCVSPEDGCGSLSTPAFDGSTLYLGAGVRDPNLFSTGSLYALNPADGTVIWQRDLSGTVVAPVTVANGLVYASTTTGLEIYDAATGQCFWSDNKRGLLYSQPVVANGTVYSTYLSGEVVAWGAPASTSSALYSFNSASNLPALASGAIVTAFGQNLDGATVTVTDNTDTERPADLVYVLPSQISYIVPDGTAAGRATVKVKTGAGKTLTGALQISEVSPGIFTANSDGKGVAAAQAVLVGADGTQTTVPVLQCSSAPGSCTAVPINLGSETDEVILILYATGVRGTASLADVHCLIGGGPCEVLYAGPQGSEGLDQINLKIPRGLRGRGLVDVKLSIAGQLANTVALSIQ